MKPQNYQVRLDVKTVKLQKNINTVHVVLSSRELGIKLRWETWASVLGQYFTLLCFH